ncbi:MAG: transglycosylase domain-containing protein, partial [Actinobacteria bacterium]|nr:transglycosylase domain-containing protein [Actinomycetota bacterium]
MAAEPSHPSTATTLVKLLVSLLAAGVLCAGVLLPYVGGAGLFAGKAAGKFIDTTCNLTESQPPLKTTILARDGKTVLATLFTQNRQPVPLSDVPQSLQDALIATEDRRFYQHHGVDLRGLLRSAVSTSGGDTQGGSTLTMQYVKQVRYFQAIEANDQAAAAAAVNQNLDRKMEDAKCAIDIEKRESKATILDNYLNIAFFGENSYGIQTAAETYFGVPAKKLTLPQSALLVGLLRAPSAYDPFVNRSAALQRRNQVIQNLVTVGKLSQDAAAKAEATPISLATTQPPLVQEGCNNPVAGAPRNIGFFCDYVVNWLTTVQGIPLNQLMTGGYQIVTTLDPSIQNSAQAQMNDSVPSTSPMTAVLPVVQPVTGDILAMASSKTYGAGKGQTEQQIFTNYTASGASTYKVFAMLAALETGVPSNWPLLTVGSTGTYTPRSCQRAAPVGNGDANETYNPTETLTTATSKSDNTFYVGMADQLFGCNLQPIIDLMTKLGMKGLQQHDPADNPQYSYAQNLALYQAAQELILGNVPTSPLELTGAYAAIANNGIFNTPAPVLHIMNSNGAPIAPHRAAGVQVLAPQVAAQAMTILSGETTGIGTSASMFTGWYNTNSSPIAGKTG